MTAVGLSGVSSINGNNLAMTTVKALDVVAAIIERDGKILLAQRPAHADQVRLWEFAGGSRRKSAAGAGARTA